MLQEPRFAGLFTYEIKKYSLGLSNAYIPFHQKDKHILDSTQTAAIRKLATLTKQPHFLLLAFSVALIAVCLLMPGLSGAFIFDDTPNIVTNTNLHLRQPTLEDVLYAAYSFEPGHGSRALSMLSFALDYWRAGLDPRAFKTTNLMIHGLTVFCLAVLLRRLLSIVGWGPRHAALGALIIALMWAAHPLQVSSVLYVVQRMQTLATLFIVLALWAYLGMRRAQIAGTRSRQYGVLLGLFWALGFASKEDAVLLPIYTLVLELTVLRFRAARPLMAKLYARGYLLLTAVATTAFLLWLAPHFWTWQPYPGRDFNTVERLLSQFRALAMYLGQIIWPLPNRLPFYYDHFAVSRSLWQPATTLPSMLLIAGLLAAAWHWRRRRPLFALGILMFFAGHLLTSNVIGLELAFEHRNHFPLIGALLAAADLAEAAWGKWLLPQSLGVVFLVVIVMAMGAMTARRAHDWGDELRLSEKLVEYAPTSERAWVQLSGIYALRGMSEPNSADLARGIAIAEEGVARTGSVPLLTNIVINKTMQGKDPRSDWAKLFLRLQQVPMSAQNRNTLWTLLSNTERGIALDRENVAEVIEIVTARWQFSAYENLRFGAFIHNETRHPERAFPYLHRAVVLASPQDAPDIAKMLAELKATGRGDWAKELENVWNATRKTE